MSLWFFVLVLEGNCFAIPRRVKCIYELSDVLRSHVQLQSDGCNFCRNVDSVPKVSNISPDEFENNYAYDGVPVVITDAMKNWTAQKVFDYHFFKDLYAESDLDASQCQFLPYKSGFADMYDFLSMEPKRANLEEGSKPWYVGWNNCDENATKSLRTLYSRPYFLPVTSESKTSDWIFMGSPGYGAQMHVDHVHFPSWQAQLRGSKLWTLLPPPECTSVCKKLQVLVESGEIIVLDTNKWFHETKIVGDQISITIGAEYD
ncbi:hypothetical protein M8J75_011431 [Diaphorina citri]|nr:hypothetical protein M8J75_011431 [Diaphorina citri]